MPLNCQHHVSWVRPIAGGLHQCNLCGSAVGRTDVYPKVDDLPEAFRRAWDAHEARRGQPPDAAAKAPGGDAH